MGLRKSLFFMSLLAVMCLWSPSVLAHRVNLFCSVEHGVLSGEGYYSRGKPAREGMIEVYPADREDVIARAKTDEKGRFSVAVKAAGPLRVVLNAGQGHRAEFILAGADGGTVASEEEDTGPGVAAVMLGLCGIAGIFALIYRLKKSAIRHNRVG